MTTSRLAVYSTWYPGVERFLPEWARSLASQTDHDFDLWLGVQGLDAGTLVEELGLSGTRWVVSGTGESPARVRERALTRLVGDYRAVIFVDSDDVLLPSRIAAARAALEEHDVAGCALRIVDEQGKDVGARFGPTPGDDWSELLPRHNVFGLSNSAYRTDVLWRLLPLPGDCILIDWLLATRAWILGCDLSFDDEPRMLYRQYGENVARVLPPFSEEDLLRATKRVDFHYRLVLDDPSRRPSEGARACLEAARARFERFEAFVTSNSAGRRRYVDALNALPPRYVWWWAIANPELETIWTK